MKITFTVEERAAGKGRPRFTRIGGRGVRTYTPAATAKRERGIAAAYRRTVGNLDPHTGAVIVDIIAEYLPPKSWPKWKRANPGHKVTKPDADNLEKLCLDALNRIAWKDDSQVIDVRTRKVYGDADRLTICIERI